MSRTVKVTFSDGSYVAEGWGGKCEYSGNFEFKPGDVCRVEPPNSRAKRYRGRICQLLDSVTEANAVKVVFLDTNKSGSVQVGDLVPHQ